MDASGNIIVANTGSNDNNVAGSLFKINPQTRGQSKIVSSFGAYSQTDSVEVGENGTLFVGSVNNTLYPGQVLAVTGVNQYSTLASDNLLSEVEGMRVYHFVPPTLTPTSTSLTSSPNPSTAGQQVTFTATVTPQGSGTPTGSVQFKIDNSTFAAGLVGNTATFTTGLSAGTHLVTASYIGDSSFSGSTSNTVQQTVNPPAAYGTSADPSDDATTGDGMTNASL